jgi:hypothetical protein
MSTGSEWRILGDDQCEFGRFSSALSSGLGLTNATALTGWRVAY